MNRIYVMALALAISMSACGENEESGDASQKEKTAQTTADSGEKSDKADDQAVQNAERVLADPNTFKEVIQDSSVVVVDLRTAGELEGGMIEGAQHVDFMADGFQEKLKNMDKSKTYAVYCASGGRSGKASNMMKEMGFTKVYDLDGGFGAWQSGGFPVANQ